MSGVTFHVTWNPNTRAQKLIYLQQGWIQMIQSELHRTHPFLVLSSSVSGTQLFRSLWRLPVLIFLGFTKSKPLWHCLCYLYFSMHFMLLNSVDPITFSNAEYFGSIITKICAIGKGERKA